MASIRLSGDLVGTVRVRVKPARASRSRHSGSVRSRPPGNISINRSSSLPGCGRASSGSTVSTRIRRPPRCPASACLLWAAFGIDRPGPEVISDTRYAAHSTVQIRLAYLLIPADSTAAGQELVPHAVRWALPGYLAEVTRVRCLARKAPRLLCLWERCCQMLRKCDPAFRRLHVRPCTPR